MKKWKPGDRIPYAGRVYDKTELKYLREAADEFWLTEGRWTKRFEKEFSKYLGINYSIFVNSGSSANLLAFMTLTQPELGNRRIKRGDEVITTACCFPTTIAPIIQYGAVPVFVDIDIPSYNIDCSQLEKALSPKTKAIMIAHTLGNPFNAKEVLEFCIKHDLWLIEDNSDALGSVCSKVKTGTIGDISTCSFYPAHHMTTGEGGMVCTGNPELYKIIKSLRDWGRDCICPTGQDNTCGKRFELQKGKLPFGYDHKYIYSHFGYNLKATDLQAAIGCAQMKKLPKFVEVRRKNWKAIDKALRESKAVDYYYLPQEQPYGRASWFGYVLSVKDVLYTRKNVVKFLEERGIQTRMLFAGNILLHPCFDNLELNKDYRIIGDLKNSNFVTNNTFWIGVYPGINEEMLESMTKTLGHLT